MNLLALAGNVFWLYALIYNEEHIFYLQLNYYNNQLIASKKYLYNWDFLYAL